MTEVLIVVFKVDNASDMLELLEHDYRIYDHIIISEESEK